MPRSPTVPLIPKSSRKDILWPALPTPSGAQYLALLYQIEASQWWPAETLRAQQFRQLSVLLGHAARTVPFYKNRLRAAGIEPGKPVTEEVWTRIPPLTREDIQGAGKTLLSEQPPTAHGKISRVTTSGSTGKPVTIARTALELTYWQSITFRDYIWHGRDLTKKLAAIRSVARGVAKYPEVSEAALGALPPPRCSPTDRPCCSA